MFGVGYSEGGSGERPEHKLVQTDAGETEFFDSVADPDGTNNLAADPAYAEPLKVLTAKLTDFPAAAVPAAMEAIPVAPEVPKVSAPGPAAPKVPTVPPIPAEQPDAPKAPKVPAAPDAATPPATAASHL